jgi:hypothetical protein
MESMPRIPYFGARKKSKKSKKKPLRAKASKVAVENHKYGTIYSVHYRLFYRCEGHPVEQRKNGRRWQMGRGAPCGGGENPGKIL